MSDNHPRLDCLADSNIVGNKQSNCVQAERHDERYELIRAWPEEISKFRTRVPEEVSYPKLVVNCLDNIEARHEIQDLWPDVIIDGAIGAFPCQVSVHPWGEDVACLRCLFKQPAGERAERAAARATGLSLDRVQQAFDVVTEADVEKASLEKQAWLRGRIGKEIC